MKDRMNSENYSKLQFNTDTLQHKIDRLLYQEIIHRIKINHILSLIEKYLGFSLNDDDAEIKLNQLSDTVEIPDILYQIVKSNASKKC